MNVRQLIENLKKAPATSEVCFEGNGIWPISGIRIGKMPKSKVGYVKLVSAGEGFKHFPVSRES